jgi:hypothetical protein
MNPDEGAPEMQVSHEQMVDILRGIHARAGGTGGILNLIRGSEVRGAADLSVLSDLVHEPERKLQLARHAADEGRHGYILLRRMTELGFRAFRLPPSLDRLEGLLERSRARDVKLVYAERGQVSEPELMEMTIAALIPERDAFFKLRANHDVLDHDPKTRAVLGGILRDEQRHIDYLTEWLAGFERRFSARAVNAALERLQQVFEEQNVLYYGALQEYFSEAAAA